jgi:hypothetical protein
MKQIDLSPRALAFLLSLAVIVAAVLLGKWKVLAPEAIGTLLGTVAAALGLLLRTSGGGGPPPAGTGSAGGSARPGDTLSPPAVMLSAHLCACDEPNSTGRTASVLVGAAFAGAMAAHLCAML